MGLPHSVKRACLLGTVLIASTSLTACGWFGFGRTDDKPAAVAATNVQAAPMPVGGQAPIFDPYAAVYGQQTNALGSGLYGQNLGYYYGNQPVPDYSYQQVQPQFNFQQTPIPAQQTTTLVQQSVTQCANWAELYPQLQSNLTPGGLTVYQTTDGRGIYFDMPHSFIYGVDGSAPIAPAVSRLVATLASPTPGLYAQIIGHTDQSNGRTDAVDLEYSGGLATYMSQLLQSDGMLAAKIQTAGFGFRQPATSGSGDRVEIRLVPAQNCPGVNDPAPAPQPVAQQTQVLPQSQVVGYQTQVIGQPQVQFQTVPAGFQPQPQFQPGFQGGFQAQPGFQVQPQFQAGFQGGFQPAPQPAGAVAPWQSFQAQPGAQFAR